MLTLNQFKSILSQIDTIDILYKGIRIASHFHITELGSVRKSYIDCGGQKREEHYATMQVWIAGDTDHRLSPQKLLSIIELAKDLDITGDMPLFFEYQSDTIGKYAISWNGKAFVLEPTQTDCLAKDKCGIRQDQIPQKDACCSGGNCC